VTILPLEGGGLLRILITLMGPSTWGLVNSIWGMIRFHGFVPDRVHVLGRDRDGGDFDNLGKMLEPLLEEYGSRGELNFERISGGSVKDVYDRVDSILREREETDEIALDVTPGRKAGVLGSLLAGFEDGEISRFDHVFYLYIESLRNASRPFILIPRSQQQCHDIIKENRRKGK
jgi:hypothetical protein